MKLMYGRFSLREAMSPRGYSTGEEASPRNRFVLHSSAPVEELWAESVAELMTVPGRALRFQKNTQPFVVSIHIQHDACCMRFWLAVPLVFDF